MNAIKILMDEHRLIEQVLGSLETLALDVEAARPLERPDVAGYATFFKQFADACHHGKEEDLLFARMIERGMPRDSGPIGVMLHEHRAGRQRVGALHSIGEGRGEVDATQRQLFLEASFDYVPLLRQHILKEDRILYPMAVRLLEPAELERLETEFEAFDRRQRDSGEIDRLRGIAEALVARFRPDPVRMAAASDAVSCGA